MHTEQIVIVGAGGHGKVVLDALLKVGVLPASLRVIDSNPSLVGDLMLGVVVERQSEEILSRVRQFHVAIGNNTVRQRIHERLMSFGGVAHTVIHSAAIVSSFAGIGRGSFVAARAVVAPSATIAESVIINHAAVVDHDCAIGPFTHIAPSAALSGAVKVGKRVLIGTGAVVLPGLVVGDGAIVGAGAVVTSDVPDGACVVGVPARILTRGQRD